MSNEKLQKLEQEIKSKLSNLPYCHVKLNTGLIYETHNKEDTEYDEIDIRFYDENNPFINTNWSLSINNNNAINNDKNLNNFYISVFFDDYEYSNKIIHFDKQDEVVDFAYNFAKSHSNLIAMLKTMKVLDN